MTTARATTVGRIGFAVLSLGVWSLFSATTGRDVLPSPLVTAQTLAGGFRDGWLLDATLVTLSETIPAFLLAAIVGLIAGGALGIARYRGDVFEPLILGTYAIPKVTLYPIFLILFKVGAASKIAFGFFHGVFPIQILTQSATANIKPTYLKVARSLRLSSRQTLQFVVLPAIVPMLVIGLRLAFSLTFIGVILGEMFASHAGLGFLLGAADATFNIKRILAVIVVLAAIGIGVNALFYWWERRVGHARADVAENALAL
jgi:NitT/TauT family transport system permease protein